jgi:hypothetical protein
MLILREMGLLDNCVAGHTKVFIGQPQTVFSLEKLRADRILYVITFLQKVLFHFLKLARILWINSRCSVEHLLGGNAKDGGPFWRFRCAIDDTSFGFMSSSSVKNYGINK